MKGFAIGGAQIRRTGKRPDDEGLPGLYQNGIIAGHVRTVALNVGVLPVPFRRLLGPPLLPPWPATANRRR